MLKKELKEEFMLIVWHTIRWWDFCLLELEKKSNGTNFYWVMLLMFPIWKYWSILLQRPQKSSWISTHFNTENYTWWFDIVSCLMFLRHFFQNTYWKIFKTIQYKKTWDTLKIFLSDILRHFFPKYTFENI